MKYIKLFEKIEETERRFFVSTMNNVRGKDSDVWYRPNKLPAKLQKVYNRMKFHVGDHVWYEKRKRVIRSVQLFCKDSFPYFLEQIDIVDKNNIEGQSAWVSSESLTLIPVYEIDAEKYNL